MGFPSACCNVLVPKPLVVLVLMLDQIKLPFSMALSYFGLFSPSEFPEPPATIPPSDDDDDDNNDDHAYRLSIADLPAPPLPPHATPASIKSRLPVIEYAMLQRNNAPPEAAFGGGGGVVPEEEEEEEEELCAVCLCDFEARDEVRELSNCRHAFHRACIDKWVDQGQLTCPLCRSHLLPKISRRRREHISSSSSSWMVESLSYLFREESSS